MAMTERDKVLAMLMPGLALGLFYGFMLPWASAKQEINPEAQLTAAKKKLDALKGSTPDPNGIVAKRMQNIEVNAQIKKIEAEKLVLEEQWQAVTGSAKSSVSINVLHDLGELLRKHHLKVQSQHKIDAKSIDKANLPKSLQEVLAKMEGRNRSEGRMLEFQLQGEYLNVLAALLELTEKDWPVFPVGLNLEPGDATGGLRTWKLILWT